MAITMTVVDAGDIVFDVAENGLGADHAFPLTVRELTAQHTQAAVVATVQDGKLTDFGIRTLRCW